MLRVIFVVINWFLNRHYGGIDTKIEDVSFVFKEIGTSSHRLRNVTQFSCHESVSRESSSSASIVLKSVYQV